MKRLLAVLILLASPTLAAPYGACNGAAESLGACRPGSVAWFAFDASTVDLVADIQQWAQEDGGYQVTVPCLASEAYERNILTAAGVAEDSCDVGELGDEIANPQTVNEFTYFFLRNLLRDHFVTWKSRSQEQEALEALSPVGEPDFGNGQE